jgi:hypothetical protein
MWRRRAVGDGMSAWPDARHERALYGDPSSRIVLACLTRARCPTSPISPPRER